MYRAIAAACVALLLLAIPVSRAKGADSGKITVFIDGLRNNNGVTRIALFNSEGSYTDISSAPDQAGKAFRKAAADISANTSTYTFDDIPYGEYAIKFFHDENNNDLFKVGLLGTPKVEYGFSNNVTGKFGPAPYSKVKFTLDVPEYKMIIDLTARADLWKKNVKQPRQKKPPA
jgi:uncharacterized protein (DUF2141 family)